MHEHPHLTDKCGVGDSVELDAGLFAEVLQQGVCLLVIGINAGGTHARVDDFCRKAINDFCFPAFLLPYERGYEWRKALRVYHR